MIAGLIFGFSTALQSTPSGLSSHNYESIKQHISLKQRDLGFQKIDWRTSVFDGAVAANQQDKPMILWLYFGDPRGGC
jgi:hypothetical protein